MPGVPAAGPLPSRPPRTEPARAGDVPPGVRLHLRATCTAAEAAGQPGDGDLGYLGGVSWSGFRQPINANGPSVFKAGRPVPVPFQLIGARAGITDPRATPPSSRSRIASVP
jgi:hypothetical protein